MIPKAMIIAAVILILVLPDALLADPRAEMIKLICGTQIEQNGTINVANFVSTMDKLTAQMQTSGHGTAATGSGRHASVGLAQCFGDLSSADCIVCYVEARNILPQCYPHNGGRVYLDGCFLRAQNYTFFQEYSGPDDRAVCGNRTRYDAAFEASAREALSRAVSAASSNTRYARAKVSVAGAANESAYALADCWRTISASACRACLESAYASVSGCLPASEARGLNTGCFIRYSDSDFMNPVPPNGSSRGRVMAIVLVAVSGTAVWTIVAGIGVYVWKNRTIQKKRKGDAKNLVKSLDDSSLNFKYSALDRATGSFEEANKLGQGGYGTVYKGVLADGREIAVKRLFFNNKHRAADFYNEVNIISSIEHKNLVRLLGCSCSAQESLLVYEFCPNKSLDGFIFDINKGKTLNWEMRLKIITGTAEGLVYLHENTETRIIHRDIKSSNILLDSKMRAKIADFGLARSFQENKSHISTAIAGTLGYMAPEYLAYGELTEKADVYSFGVLLLEIVSGRRNNESENSDYTDSLLTRAWIHFQQRTVEQLVDPNLMLLDCNTTNAVNEILRVVHVGLLCTQETPSSRPSMSKALLMLLAKEDPPAPSKPPFMDDETMEFTYSSQSTAASILNHARAASVSASSVATASPSTFLPR